MASSGFRHCVSSGENENVKGPMEYVSETQECICGRCGQVLIPNHNNESPEAHFKSCLNSTNNGLVMVYKNLRKMEQKFQVLNDEIREMKKKMDTVKSEVMEEVKAQSLNLKTELKNEILALKSGEVKDKDQSTLFSRIEVLEEGMREKVREMGVAQEMKMVEANGRVSGMTEAISTIIHSVLEVQGKESTSSADTLLSNELDRSKKETEALRVQLRMSEGEIQTIKTQLEDKTAHLETETFSEQMTTTNVLKRQMEDEAPKQSAKIQKFGHLEPSLFDQMTIPMNCFNLVTHNHLFQAGYKWTIDDIEETILASKTFELSSEMFQWNGYPVQARVKLQLKEDGYVYLSVCETKSKDFGLPIPDVYYLLKHKNARYPKHKCKSMGYLSGTSFRSSLAFKIRFGHKDWFRDSAYKVNDSVEIEIYVDPAPMTQVYSYDGILEWRMENYKKRLELEENNLVIYQESPFFYTSPRGYRVQARMFLNEDDGGVMTVRLSFLTGEFDAELPKSFDHFTTVTLINRKIPKRCVSKTIAENIRNEAEYDFNICKKENVENFLENDTLFFKVVIKAQ